MDSLSAVARLRNKYSADEPPQHGRGLRVSRPTPGLVAHSQSYRFLSPVWQRSHTYIIDDIQTRNRQARERRNRLRGAAAMPSTGLVNSEAEPPVPAEAEMHTERRLEPLGTAP